MTAPVDMTSSPPTNAPADAPVPRRAAERPRRTLLKRLRRIVRLLRLKERMPKSLFGRALLIIILPIALMQIAVAYAFFDAHWQTVTSRLSEGVAGDIGMVLDLYERADPADRVGAIEPVVEGTLGVSIELEPDARLPTTVRSSFFRVLDRTLRRALSEKLDHEFWFDTTRYPAYVDIRVQVDDGVLRLIVPRDRVFATTGHIFLLWIVGATTLLTTISIIYIRNQAKPIERLAAAAELFGRGQDAPNFRPSGASEVRQAAQAFIEMRERINRHITQRTALLAGVSHDLRTPLTRLRLQLALLPKTDEADAMRSDLADMQATLDEYLDFAKGAGGEEPELADIGAIARAAAEAAAHEGVEISVETEGDLELAVRTMAMKRCLMNLASNAAAHAATVKLAARRFQTAIVIDVDDDGPGIAEADREAAFRPFSRLDEARTRNAKGVGLGLTIARDVARAHGGDVTLSESPLGGLRARVRLPADPYSTEQ